jgi:hypothetical protein
MGALQSAREKARLAMKARAESAAMGAMAAASSEAPVMPAPATAKVKFEASAERVRKATAEPVAVGGPEQLQKPAAAGKPKPGITKEEGLSRLMQAKKRAREGMEDE